MSTETPPSIAKSKELSSLQGRRDSTDSGIALDIYFKEKQQPSPKADKILKKFAL